MMTFSDIDLFELKRNGRRRGDRIDIGTDKLKAWEENAKKRGKEEKIQKGLKEKRKDGEVTVLKYRRRRN
jgi:hypothetical protein